jgi:hypothetical protein
VAAKVTRSKSPELADLRRRVDALDAEVAELRRQVRGNGSKPGEPWWQALAGKYDDDPVFAEVVKEGRKWRAAQRTHPGERPCSFLTPT